MSKGPPPTEFRLARTPPYSGVCGGDLYKMSSTRRESEPHLDGRVPYNHVQHLVNIGNVNNRVVASWSNTLRPHAKGSRSPRPWNNDPRVVPRTKPPPTPPRSMLFNHRVVRMPSQDAVSSTTSSSEEEQLPPAPLGSALDAMRATVLKAVYEDPALTRLYQ